MMMLMTNRATARGALGGFWKITKLFWMECSWSHNRVADSWLHNHNHDDANDVDDDDEEDGEDDDYHDDE
eukprot:7335499-Karenia_brevis.AAC.1